ncbi:MAG: hypothetical protein JXO22_15210 [Phycisphaerae bacterium]|nr:hypothetical protein [Phycisphaerae bacterium]
MNTRLIIGAACAAIFVSTASAEKHYLLTGVDPTLYPGVARSITGDNGLGVYPDLHDGDRLAGTSDVGTAVTFMGVGTPMYAPNQFGSLSMFYRRGYVYMPQYGLTAPLLGIEFIGGPLLDLDGDPNDAGRSLIPSSGVPAVEMPGSDSFIDLDIDTAGGTITLVDLDALGTNENGPFIAAANATALFTIAGTQPDASKGDPINPGIDTRVGTLTAFAGNSGTLAGVYQVADLGYEFWEDSIDPASSTAGQLGTMQFLGSLGGWVIERDAHTGSFPTLAGEGLGGTAWPLVDTSQIGQTFDTANGLAGGTATIANGFYNGSTLLDDFTTPENGGLALTDFGGDLGAYLDAVVVPLLTPEATRFVYLESAGFGINNSYDPIFADTVGYDVLIIAAAVDECAGEVRGDSNCDGVADVFDIDAFVLAIMNADDWQQSYTCDFLCVNDTDRDGTVDVFDIDTFVACITGQ